jgi:hypothetical protein
LPFSPVHNAIWRPASRSISPSISSSICSTPFAPSIWRPASRTSAPPGVGSSCPAAGQIPICLHGASRRPGLPGAPRLSPCLDPQPWPTTQAAAAASARKGGPPLRCLWSVDLAAVRQGGDGGRLNEAATASDLREHLPELRRPATSQPPDDGNDSLPLRPPNLQLSGVQ